MRPLDKLLEKLALNKTACTPAIAKKLLSDPGTCALALCVAAKDLLGECHRWEPEALWLTLEQYSVDMPVENRAKLLAAHTLIDMPSFFWDAGVCEKTALSFAGKEPNPDILEEATVAELAWAVVEAHQLMDYNGEPSQEFGHECCAYAAVVLHREGFVLAPTQLVFAQDILDKTNPARGAESLKTELKKQWEALDKTHLEEMVFTESPPDVQLAKLAAILLHIREREGRTAADLTMLRQP